MSMFLGTHQNRFDAKGRVSIPASFRAALKSQAQPGDPLVILRPSHLHPCVEGWTVGAFASLATPLDEYDPFSEDHEDLAASLYADAYPLDSDREGRIILPENLRTHAALIDEVSFMGLGRTFQIWNPEAAAERRQAARSRARTLATSRRSAGAPVTGNTAGATE
ncbi:division/cell wall cluster transcriptional repressor MraZ [Gluconobacter sphaericus]|uniref:Transcriptional regulator MraZ n=1 Tax=Gluconobacter sphaericus NBRC 12467 TaxID=1307951 RepID=A0AA37SMF6_9PROT|nr:division/cell wall cluster transcriptional repressor MraZ [Gluconobacter sphaericus]MBF0886323.1 division/cell wall cluster transcriptional repressor MraZ [Gluconobacter sphaericus]MBS1086333.1 division/cell wall cluster transcriptional repressor MraZ [Gluconobacter sphaericus]MBS1096043.1 division/cell wall cluster transcriptional repressor MraZ [Gluconobacter sphaericus]MBS1100331.1 division/cell wall cluster transcriptional repressor MraZ [Gluconobacter sphaericus]QQX91243.1 division/cel